MHIEVLQVMMRESIQVVENVELDAKASKVEMKLKIKDAQINKLREQMYLRDELLEEGRRVLRKGGM